jgi:hypothetical protein
MKRFAAILLFGLASLGMVNRATAEDREARVTIPFDFTFGRMLLPAGTYTITSPNQISVVLNNGKQSAAALRSSVAEEDHSGADRLVFSKYGDRYFLRVILCSTSHLNLEFPASKAEKQAQLNRAGFDRNDRILLALNN